MSTNGSLLEMVLEGHIKIKCISAVPEADADESAAPCGQTHTLHFLPGKTGSHTHTTRIHSHTHRCHLGSAAQSIGWNRWPFPPQCRDTPLPVPVQTAPLQDRRTHGSYKCNPVNNQTDLCFQDGNRWAVDVTADFTRDFVLQFDKRHIAPGCDPHSTRPVRSVQFPVSCPGLNIHTNHNVNVH